MCIKTNINYLNNNHFWGWDIVCLDTGALLDLLQEFVLSCTIWALHDGKLVFNLCTIAALLCGVLSFTTSIAVAEVNLSVSLAAVLVLVHLEVPDSSASLWFVFTSVLLQDFKVWLRLLAGLLGQGTLTVECRDDFSQSTTDWILLSTCWTATADSGIVDGTPRSWCWASAWCTWTILASVVADLCLVVGNVLSVGVSESDLDSLLALLAAWSPWSPLVWAGGTCGVVL